MERELDRVERDPVDHLPPQSSRNSSHTHNPDEAEPSQVPSTQRCLMDPTCNKRGDQTIIRMNLVVLNGRHPEGANPRVMDQTDRLPDDGGKGDC